MGVLVKGTTYSTGGTVTAANLNAHVDDAEFAASAYDNVTISKNASGALYIKSVGTGQLANDSVTPDKVDLTNASSFDFSNVAGFRHRSIQGNVNHTSAGALSLDMFNGNCQLVNVSTNITSVGPITTDSFYAGGHFTFILRYTATGLSGPGTGDWNSKWLFPSGFNGTLSMTNGTYDLISGVIVNIGSNTFRYIVTAATNLVNP